MHIGSKEDVEDDDIPLEAWDNGIWFGVDNNGAPFEAIEDAPAMPVLQDALPKEEQGAAGEQADDGGQHEELEKVGQKEKKDKKEKKHKKEKLEQNDDGGEEKPDNKRAAQAAASSSSPKKKRGDKGNVWEKVSLLFSFSNW